MSAIGLLMLAQSATASTTPAACDARTEVVSAERCLRYGQTWAAERTFRLVAGVGFFSSGLDASNRNYTAKSSNDKSGSGTSYSGDRLGIGMVRTYGMDFDIHGFVSDHVYVGADMAFGLGRAAPRNSITGEGWTYSPTSGIDLVQMRMGATVGLRIPTPYLSLRLESLVGFEIVSISHDASPGPGAASVRASSVAIGFLLEPRIAIDLWTAPWATVSLWGGKDVFHRSDTSMGLVFSLHGRSFDGGF